jgi:hypothetical protein
MTSEFVLSVSSGKKILSIGNGQCLDGATSRNCHIAACAPQHQFGLLISRGDNRSGHMLRISPFAQVSALIFTV